jgi:hypothetical protein
VISGRNPSTGLDDSSPGAPLAPQVVTDHESGPADQHFCWTLSSFQPLLEAEVYADTTLQSAVFEDVLS